MIYDPNNEMTNEELDVLAAKDFHAFLEYLDAKSEYLKKFTKPLDEYHLKKFGAMDAVNRGEEVTDSVIQKAKKIAKENQ